MSPDLFLQDQVIVSRKRSFLLMPLLTIRVRRKLNLSTAGLMAKSPQTPTVLQTPRYQRVLHQPEVTCYWITSVSASLHPESLVLGTVSPMPLIIPEAAIPILPDTVGRDKEC